MGKDIVRQTKQTLAQHLRAVGYVRWSRMFVAIIFVWSLFVPIFMQLSEAKAYALTPDMHKVLGSANSNLSAKFSFDEAANKWQFNKNGVASLADSIAKRQTAQSSEEIASALSQISAKQIGGAGKNDQSLYSVDLPVKAKEGIVYYDNVTKLSFKMIPQFTSLDGKLVDGRIVYPFGGAGKIVYTAKSNGLKEDIVLEKYIGDTLRYGYELDLPDSLEARLLDDGSIGVYSANPALYGDITFSSDEDRARVMEGRKEGVKNHMVFGIPAPFIKDQTGRVGNTRYELEGDKLTVVAKGLKELKYPLAVDPSVMITSSSDFQSGNNEGMISFGTTGQITRGSITGGTVGTWRFTDNSVDRGASQGAGSGAANGMIAARNAHPTVTYNGYIYAIGGDTQGTNINTVERAPLNSNGTVGTWISSGTLPENRADHAAFAYNGYMYIVGGFIGGGSYSADVKFAAINPSDGSLGTWTSTNSLPVGRTNHAALAYNGKMYVINGCTTASGNCNTANPTAIVYCADILATGQVGAWATCSSTGLSGRDGYSAVAYNGYIYGLGGCETYSLFACNSQPRSVQSAKINADGSLGSWTSSTTLFTGDRGRANLVVNNGYLYLTGDSGIDYVNDMQYAPIHANGSVGTWQATSSYAQTRNSGSLSVYNNYLYMVGGCTARSAGLCSNTKNDVQYVAIDSPGTTGPYTATTSYETTARQAFATTVHNNYIYVIGGTTGISGSKADMLSTTRYAPINSDGTVGAWTTASSNFANTNSGVGGQTCTPSCPGRVNMAAGVHNGYLYIAGGGSNGSPDVWSDVQSAVICTGVNAPVSGCAGAGDLRNWTTLFTDYLTNSTTTYTDANGRSHVGMQIYNGTMYLMGGVGQSSGGNTDPHSHIYTATLTNTGGVGNFSLSSVALPTARAGVDSFVHEGNLYIVGGGAGPTWAGIGQDEADVWFIPINPDGTLDGTTGWKDANAVGNGGSGVSFATKNDRNNYGVSVSNGQIYITGGVDTTTNTTTTAKKASINSNGSLSAWTSTADFTTGRYQHGMVAVRGSIYIFGGCRVRSILLGQNCSGTANMHTDTQVTRINNGGNGQTNSWTASSSNGSAALGGYAAYNGYVYNIRGCGGGIGSGDLNCDNTGTGTQGMVYAAVNSDGSFGSWQTLNATGTPPPAIYGTSAVAHNGYLYVVGGCTNYASSTCAAMSKQVYYAQINSNGNVGAWATTTDFDASVGRYGLSAVAYNGYLYVVGGCTATSAGNCTAYENTVRMAQINSNGTVGAWSSAGNSFTGARFWHSAVAYNSKLYVLGGCAAMVTENCTNLKNDVQVININSNGSLNGSWRTIRSFDTARSALGAVAYNGYLYVVGGCAQFATTGGNCANYLGDIQYAAILPGGSLGTWNKSATNLANGVLGHGLAVSNGSLVTLFGIRATHTFETVARRSPITVQPRIGQYSKLVAVNPTTDIAGVYYNGTLGEGSSVQYRVAPSSGVFEAITAATPGNGSEPTPLCGQGSIYYVQIVVTADDNRRATFGESSQSSVTDVTTYYRLNATPPPNLRLHGGKWFYSETQQPLDLCKA